MADVANPLNNEPIVDPMTGLPTRRFFAWMNSNSNLNSDSSIITETASDQLQPTSAIGALNKRLDNLELMIMHQSAIKRDGGGDDVEIVSYSAEINELRKRVKDLEIGA